MPNIVEQFKKSKRTLENLKSEKSKSSGKIEQILQNLQEKFRVSSLEEAEAKLEELTEKHLELESEISSKQQDLDAIIEKATR